MPDFTLPAYQGGTVTLSALRGKNVMIIFPRGYAAENYWCTICNYKYAELIRAFNPSSMSYSLAMSSWFPRNAR
jgi:peroxiredoxin